MAINKIEMKTCSRYEASVKVGGVIRKKRFLTPRSKDMGVGDEASPSNGSTAPFDVFAGL